MLINSGCLSYGTMTDLASEFFHLCFNEHMLLHQEIKYLTFKITLRKGAHVISVGLNNINNI